MGRRLNLNRENLTALESDELLQVAGALPWTPWCHITIELGEKLREQLSLDCP